MNFEEFAAGHGLILRGIDYGRWVRTSTDDHPRKKNGAYKHLGDVAFVQNHATMAEPAIWSDRDKTTSPERVISIRASASNQIKDGQQKAARKAAWILSQTEESQHAYLDRKGFPEQRMPTWEKDGQRLLVIPMRIGRDLVGCQIISPDGDKRFLSGQRCKGASYVIDAKGKDVWCEGFATGLSVRKCLTSIGLRYKLLICFSAGNLATMATTGIVIADNDLSGAGEAAAKKTGLPYYLPPIVGDFNDYHQQVGTYKASMSLKQLFIR